MKKLFSLLVVAVLLFLIASVFIPAEQVRTLPVRNTVQNAVAALREPTLWRSLDSGKNTHVTEIRYMLYAIAEPTGEGDSTVFTLALLPNMSPQHNPNHCSFSYAHTTSLFYTVFPFMEKQTFDVRTVDELQRYLQDDARFYGYPIATQKLVDSFFLTKQQDIPSRDLFTTLPGMIKELTAYAGTNSCRIIAQNISITPLGPDSISLMAGLNIDKSIEGDKVYTFKQVPSTLGLLVGRYEGPFRDRTGLYKAMERYITDHALVKRGLPYERYQSSLPTADSSVIKIDLIYPVTYR